MDANIFMDTIDQFDSPVVGSQISYGLSSKASTKRRVTTLGGGYELRQQVGTQSSFQTFSCTWGPMVSSEAEKIKSFIDSKAGVYSFLFTHPVTKVKYTVVCDEGATRTDDAPGVATITADLREVQA